MSLRDELRALRTGTALCDESATVALRLSGAAAFATLDRLCPIALALQDTQLKPTLLLREDGTVFADAYVARDDEAYFLLCEGPSAAELEVWVRQHATGPELEVTRLDGSHRWLSVHGPFAWDLLATCLGGDVVGMPYLTFLRGASGVVCFRAGKTGEFGYELLVPNAEVEALRAGLEQHGREWDLTRVSLAAIDHCALENWFFNIRAEGKAGLTPLELGLQWRLTPGKDAVGSAAVKAHRASARVTCLVSEGAMSPGDVVTHDGAPAGKVLAAVDSPFVGKWVGVVLMDLPLAVPGVGGFVVGGHAARTSSPPVINNRSLYVSPQRHTWADRDSSEFPPLAL